MLNTYLPDEARKGILKRIPLDQMPVTESLKKSIQDMFGEPLSPSQVVERILKDVQQKGDAGLHSWAQKLDFAPPEKFALTAQEILSGLDEITPEQKAALEISIDRVRRFHEAQPVTSWITQSLGGTVGQLVRPIQRVGIYVPAGSAPLPSSIIMSAVPAQVAGVGEIALFGPPDRKTGKVAAILRATAAILGLEEFYAVGGAQAIGAMAYGTESIRAVDKIYGPGNLFVTLAKKQVYGTVGIDSIAGPTETVVIADDSADPAWVAADLLAQAEHDVMAAAILLSPSQTLIDHVQVEVGKQLEERSRTSILTESLQHRSGAVLTADLFEAARLSNEYAPEHLCLAIRDPWALTEKITAAGGIFIGDHSYEVLGDYVAGPSHVMPTSGSARYGSPLNVWDFVHLVSLVALDPQTSRQIGQAAAILALAEGLDAHANSAQVRQ